MTAHEALAALLTARHTVDRLHAYRELLEAVDLECAIWDGFCGRAMPANSFYAHLVSDARKRDLHTTDNVRWAQTSDMPYSRFRVLGDQGLA